MELSSAGLMTIVSLFVKEVSASFSERVILLLLRVFILVSSRPNSFIVTIVLRFKGPTSGCQVEFLLSLRSDVLEKGPVLGIPSIHSGSTDLPKCER